MKTKLLIGFVLIMALCIPGVLATGNDAMSGKHYNLNLICNKNIDQLPDVDYANNGNRIFVNCYGESRIYLQQNWDGIFNVIDYVASTRDPALFTLPAPENTYDEVTEAFTPGAYKVYLRVVGNPTGHINKMATCATGVEIRAGEEVCSTEAIINQYKSSKFRDVTKILTTLCGDFDDDTRTECYDIFDEEFEDYFWFYDNDGAKNVQLRFYPI
jgi:hypothetical protein